MDTVPVASSLSALSSKRAGGIRSFSRSLTTLAIFIIGFGIGLFVDSFSAVKESSIAGEIDKMPIFTSANVQGAVRSKGEDFLILEKSGNQMKIYFEKPVSVFKLSQLGVQADSQAQSQSVKVLGTGDIKEGAVVSAQVNFKKDQISGETKSFSNNFVIN